MRVREPVASLFYSLFLSLSLVSVSAAAAGKRSLVSWRQTLCAWSMTRGDGDS